MKDEETVVNVSKLTKDGKYLSGATGDCIRRLEMPYYKIAWNI